MHERRKVLVVAESANPELSSSSLVGWSLSKALRDGVDAHVVTHVRNREGLERAGWREGREYTAIDPGPVEHPINRFGEAVRKVVSLGWTWTTVLATLSYYYFEHQLWRRFGPSIRRGEFDLVHRITPVSPATPSLLAGHCRDAGVPFVWGPMNGGVPWPKEFRNALRREGEWLSYVRGLHRLLPGYELTRSAAAAVITGSSFAWREMEQHHDRCVYIPENAIEPSRFQVANSSRDTGPLRAAFAGRLVPLKGVDMLVDAAAPLVQSGKLAVDIIGDGPEMPALRRRVEQAGVTEGIRLHGWLDHLDVVRRLAASHVFAFPSFREFGGGAVLEAMTLGLVPVVINHGGPGELVTDETGFRVPLGPRESVVDAFREILSGLVDDPQRARRMGARARKRVERLFTWDVKARQIIEVYRWVLGERAKPDFGMPLREDAA